jgi:hypothetical protein
MTSQNWNVERPNLIIVPKNGQKETGEEKLGYSSLKR